jgi:thiol-disulfide isomerase/thioredoxin
MKKLLLIFSISIIFMFLLSSCTKEVKIKGKFMYEPEKPKPGDEITVTYTPDSTGLKNASNVKLMAYSYSIDLDQTKQSDMVKTVDGWRGKFKVPESSKGVLIKFKDGDDIDNNNKLGYLINLYDAAGNVLPGSYAGYATAIYSWGSYYLDMDRNFDSSLYYFKKDFAKNPSIKYDYLDPFLGTATKMNQDNATAVILKELSGFQSEAKSEKDYALLANWYDKGGLQNRADIYKKLLEEKYPGSEFVQREKYEAFYKESDIKKKLRMLQEFEEAYPNSKYLSRFYDVIANYYLQSSRYITLRDFMENNADKPSIYRFYSVATKMLDNNKYPLIALNIANLGVDRARAEVNNPSDKKPNYQSEQEWKEDRESMLGMNLYAYAEAFYKLGKPDKAEAPLKEAGELTKGKDEDINELYAKVLIANGKNDMAMKEIENHVKQGKATPAMKSMLKTIYIKKNGSAEGFNSYLAQFESLAKQLLVAKLEKQIFKKPAPLFTLKDLDGKKVSLKSLKGKTVILDFWATWCGPCKASFPAMQKAIEQYKNNDNVKFLFIDSWENVDDKRENAVEFLNETNYPFRVLLDEDNKVIEDYRVSGIPTKFVIDKEGNIRFMAVGFSGNTDELVDEISTMISMVN